MQKSTYTLKESRKVSRKTLREYMGFITKPPPDLSTTYHEMCDWIDEKV